MKKFSRQGGWSDCSVDAFRSGLEEKIAKQLEDAGIEYLYEKASVSYIIPASDHKYWPDFVLKNGIIIEGKGLFEVSDRKKHLLIKAQYPQLDIRFVFSNPNQKLYKGSPTTYAIWCKKHGYKYAKKLIPAEWFKEKRKTTEGLIPKPTKLEKRKEA